jgi:hypothetical protein
MHSPSHLMSYTTTAHIHIKRNPACNDGPSGPHFLSICPGLCMPACASHACTWRYVLPLTSGRPVRRWVSVVASIAFTSAHWH